MRLFVDFLKLYVEIFQIFLWYLMVLLVSLRDMFQQLIPQVNKVQYGKILFFLSLLDQLPFYPLQSFPVPFC